MSQLVSEHQKMKLRVEAYEKTQQELESKARYVLFFSTRRHHALTDAYFSSADRRRIQALEASLRSMRMTTDQRRLPVTEIARAQTAERNALAAANKKLQEENAVLRDEIDEVKAMVEVLKAQVMGTRGLVSPTQSSLIL